MDQASKFVFNANRGHVGVVEHPRLAFAEGIGEPLDGPVNVDAAVTVAVFRGQAVDADLVVDEAVAGLCLAEKFFDRVVRLQQCVLQPALRVAAAGGGICLENPALVSRT